MEPTPGFRISLAVNLKRKDSTATMPSSHDNETSQPEENDTDSLVLALRLLAIDDLGEPQEDPPQLFLGRLPDEMTEEIPVPEGLTLVGSMTRSGWRGEPETEIILDAALSAEDVREAYRQQMTAAGWFERERPGPRGGFSPSSRGGRLMLCKSERGPSLMVTTNDRQGEPTAVRLTMDTDRRNSPCVPHRHYGPDFDKDVIPELEPPPGGRYVERGWGSSRGDDIQESRATIEAKTDLEGVAVHYAGQLEAGGWTQMGGGVDGPLASSAWELTDEEGQGWVGVFTALGVPQHTLRRYILQVRVSLISEGEY